MDLPVHIWTEALLKSLHHKMIPAYLRHRGDKDRGLVAVIVDCLDGTAIAYMQYRDFNAGRLDWNQAHESPLATVDMEQWIQQQIDFDRDMWIIEVESANSGVTTQILSMLPNMVTQR